MSIRATNNAPSGAPQTTTGRAPFWAAHIPGPFVRVTFTILLVAMAVMIWLGMRNPARQIRTTVPRDNRRVVDAPRPARPPVPLVRFDVFGLWLGACSHASRRRPAEVESTACPPCHGPRS